MIIGGMIGSELAGACDEIEVLLIRRSEKLIFGKSASGYVSTVCDDEIKSFSGNSIHIDIVTGLQTMLILAKAANTCASRTALPIAPGSVPYLYHPTCDVVPKERTSHQWMFVQLNN